LTVLRDTGITTATVENAKFNTFKWVEVSGDPTLEFLAVQQNNRVSLFDLTKENLSADGFIGNITLSSFPSSTRFSFTSIEGFLVVAAGTDTIAVIEYDQSNNTISVEYKRILVR